MSDNLKIHDMVCYWIDVLDLKGWNITTEHIPLMSVTYAEETPDKDRYFVGIKINRESMLARIYHDRPLNDEYIVHELLHVKYPQKDEDWINETTEQYLYSKYKY